MLVTKLTRGVEREVRAGRRHTLRVQRQDALQPLQRVEQEEAQAVERQHGQPVGHPMLLGSLVDAGGSVEATLDRPHYRRKKGPLAREQAGHETAQRPGQADDDQAVERDLRPAEEGHGTPPLRTARVATAPPAGRP